MKHFAQKLALLVLGLAGALSLQAQNVTGTVKDANGEPLMGVFVLIEGTTIGTTTGLDGDYAIQVPDPAKASLQFSLIGMKSVTIPVNGQKVIDAVLQDDSTVLDEIVVVGYATVKRRDLLGSVSSVNSDKLAEQPVTTVSQALSGKMAGVSVVTTEGNPDADIKIRVRGGGSINTDSSPLYIVDGFPVESINDIASSEIASIDVLKDAFSTAIYGSRGANGVVIVTTKSAEKGQKVSVKFNTYAGVKTIANKKAIQPMDADNFVRFQYELASIRNKVSDSYEPYFGSFSDIGLYKGLPTNDWVKAVFGNTGSSFSADLTVSGSGDNYNWTLGYAHLGDKAIMVGSDYSRENLNFKGNYKISKAVSIDLSARYARTSVRGGGANSFNDKGTTRGNGRLKHAVSYTPIPIANLSIGADETEEYGDNAPPLQSVADNDSRRIRTNWNVNGAFNWKIMDGLKLKIEGGLEEYRQGDDRFYGLTTSYAREKATIDFRNMPANQHKEAFRTRYRNTNTLNYDFSKLLANDDHSLNALLGEEMTITKSNTLQLMAEGFPVFFDSDMAWNYMSSAAHATDFSNYYNLDDKLLSFFGRVNYDYKHKYSFGATLRADGSSKFARGHRWGFFPSAAASWTISNEDFMEDTRDWLDQLKLRYSFGTAGNNNIPSGQVLKEYASYSSSYISQALNYYVPVRVDGKAVLNNPDLTWETTYTHNVGIDFSVLRSVLSGSLEVYQNDTRNLLVLFPTGGTGYSSQYRNIGSTRNRGVELTLNAPVVQKKDFSLNISANIAYNRNTVTSIGGLDSIWGKSDWCSEIGNDYIVQKDQPLGNMYGYRVEGRYEVDDFTYTGGKWVLKPGVVDDSDIIGSQYLMPGALKLKNLDGSADNKVTAADCEVIGNAMPDFTGGFSLSGYFKGFDFSANFNYMIGNDIYNANKIEFTSSRKFQNRNLINMMDVDKRWTNIDWTTGQLITNADALAAANEGTTMWSPAIGQAIFTDWAVEDGSFLRLQSVTVGYTLPEKLTAKVHIRKLRVYATGTNLFCLTRYSGFDPEVDTRRSTPLTPGVDYSAYPKSIAVVAGLNLTF
ncbi:MAG: TonB-dependent receptor [Bacteroidales bacterium]|nr:TonB-dependent receptor [Bacteroidales bacterium]